VPAKRILVIDKDIITRKFLKQTLEKRGHQVTQAELGKEGLVFAWRDKPDVIIVDPTLPDINSELFIQKIRQDARTASTPVVALSTTLAPEFAKQCIVQGYTLYFTKETEAIPKLLAQVETIGKERTTPIFKKGIGGKVIVFLSGKGGVGVSSLAANIATTIKGYKRDAKIVLVDMVLPLGSLAARVGYKESINITTLADLPLEELTPEFMSATLPHISGWRFYLLAGSPTPEAANLLQSKKLPHLINILREEFDYIVVDVGRSLSRISLSIMQEAHLITLVLGTEKESARLGKAVHEYLLGMNIDERKLYPIINRTVGLEGLTKGEAEQILGIGVKGTIPFMGAKFTFANDQAESAVRKYSRDTGSMMLINITKDMLETVEKLKH
jgi:pilus assembly protein CpaE